MTVVNTVDAVRKRIKSGLRKEKTGTLMKMLTDPYYSLQVFFIEEELNERFAGMDAQYFEGVQNVEEWADKSRRGEA